MIRPEHDGTQFSSGDSTHVENQNNVWDRVSFSENDRLPRAVLLARERLLHRLGAVTLSSGRLVMDDPNTIGSQTMTALSVKILELLFLNYYFP